MLDWGGGDGAFVPTLLNKKNVSILEVSNVSLVSPDYQKLKEIKCDQSYEYIQVCHVLEHVSRPLDLMLMIIPYLTPGGYLYIELPQDRTDEDLHNFLLNPEQMTHGIHEHLGLYSSRSLESLGHCLGLRPMHIARINHEYDWSTTSLLQGLFRKNHVA